MAVALVKHTFLDNGPGDTGTPPGWTAFGGGLRSGNKLNSAITYVLPVTSNVAVSIEAEVSADGLGGVADRGVKLWLALNLGGLDGCLAEAHLERTAAGNRVVLRDPRNSNANMGEIQLEWPTSAAPDVRIRLKRQTILGVDKIVLQGEVSADGGGNVQWDDPSNANPPTDTATHIMRDVSAFFTDITPTSEVGFGNAVAGAYDSLWQYVLVTEANDLTTVLPYWPPAPTAASAAITETTAGGPTSIGAARQVTLTPNLSGYLATDYVRARLKRVPTGGTSASDDVKAALSDPTNVVAPWVFGSVRDFQLSPEQVKGKLELMDRSEAGGVTPATPRTRSFEYPLSLQDRTVPIGQMQAIQADDTPPTAWVPILPSGCYGAVNKPVSLSIRVTDWQINKTTSGYRLNGGPLQNLNSLTDASDPLDAPAGIYRYSWTPPAADGIYNYQVTLIDQQGNGAPVVFNQTIMVQSAPPTGVIVVTQAPPVPAFADYAAPVGGTVYNTLHVGIQLSDTQWQLLKWDGTSSGSNQYSKIIVNGVSPGNDIQLATFYDHVELVATPRHVLGRKVTFTGPVNVAFELIDLCGNTATIGPVALNIDTGLPDATIELSPAGAGTWQPAAGASMAPGNIDVRVSVIDANFDNAGSKVTVFNPVPASIFTQNPFPAGAGPFVLGPVTVASGTGYEVRVELKDLAGNSAVKNALFNVGAPLFVVEPVGSGNSVNAVGVSHDFDGAPDDDGVIWTLSDNFIAVTVKNNGTAAGTCRYRHFIVPACLFVTPADWILVTTGNSPPTVTVPAGASVRSTGNVNFNSAHPSWPPAADFQPGGKWYPYMYDAGTALHTCTAVLVHSNDDPLVIPGINAAANFDNEANFKNVIMAAINSYPGGSDGYWNAVVGNDKIGNRNIDLRIGAAP